MQKKAWTACPSPFQLGNVSPERPGRGSERELRVPEDSEGGAGDAGRILEKIALSRRPGAGFRTKGRAGQAWAPPLQGLQLLAGGRATGRFPAAMQRLLFLTENYKYSSPHLLFKTPSNNSPPKHNKPPSPLPLPPAETGRPGPPSQPLPGSKCICKGSSTSNIR